MSLAAALVMLLPIAAAAGLGLLGPWLGRSLPPSTAVPLLTVAAVLAALTSGLVLGVAGIAVLARLTWAPARAWPVHTGSSTSLALGALAGLAMSVLLASGLRRLVLAGSDLSRAGLACRRLGAGTAGLVILDSDEADAFALPGVRGRIVVSTAMLRALPADERRALLAHEAAHLRHRHHVYQHLVEVAVAANPLLRPLARAVHAAVERWADEVAAAEVGDRRLAARALARAGLARSQSRAIGPRTPPAESGSATASGTADRTRALLAAPPRSRRVLTAAVTVLMIVSAVAATYTAAATEDRLELAQTLPTSR